MTEYKQTITKEEIDGYPLFVYAGEVIVVDQPEQVAEAVAFLAAHPCIGFDTETRPSFRKGEINQVSLLQLGTEERVYLFRLKRCGFPPALRRLLADPSVVKIGVAIHDDLKALCRVEKFVPAGFVDLQNYAAEFGIEEKSFSKMMAILFEVKISKRQRTSNWDADHFSEAQVRYAATDAWGALEMYLRLSGRPSVL